MLKQTDRIRQEKVIYAKALPLDYVRKFVKIDGFVLGVLSPKKTRIQIRNPSVIALFKICKLSKSQLRKRRNRNVVDYDYSCGV